VKRLSDPRGDDRVRHGEDGTSEKTQLAVMQQAAFAKVVEEIVGQVFEMMAEGIPNIVVPVGCKTGSAATGRGLPPRCRTRL
jgi:hypothetical protein